MLYASSSEERLQGRRDPVLGVRNATLLVAGGLLHLVVAGWLLSTRETLKQGILTLGIGIDYALYWAATVWVKATAPVAAVRLVAWKCGLPSGLLDIFWKLFATYLIVSGVLLIILARRWSRALESAAFLARWRQRRELPAAGQSGRMG